jgi:AraC-like DNA-binding protein/mannose-6-phosphate isomerase-like protein (cupin superfamily)
MHQAKSSSKERAVELPRLHGAFSVVGDLNVGFHSHETLELQFVMEGRVAVDVGGSAVTGEHGTVFMFPAQVEHNLRCDGYSRSVCLLLVDTAQVYERAEVVQLPTDAPALRWAEDLCVRCASTHRLVDELADALTLAVLTALSEAQRNQRDKQHLHPSLARALEYVDCQNGANIDADTLARAARCSYSHLSALFREQFGCGPMSYVQQRRLENAKKRLVDPYVSVAEVADQFGYEDPDYFVRAFKRRFGQPPGQWRREHAERRYSGRT